MSWLGSYPRPRGNWHLPPVTPIPDGRGVDRVRRLMKSKRAAWARMTEAEKVKYRERYGIVSMSARADMGGESNDSIRREHGGQGERAGRSPASILGIQPMHGGLHAGRETDSECNPRVFGVTPSNRADTSSAMPKKEEL